jgi:hypothetical protein
VAASEYRPASVTFLLDIFGEPGAVLFAVTASFTARPAWRAAPAALHRAVQRHVDGVVVEAHDVQGGMSPGPAAVLRLDSGVRVFVKAMSTPARTGCISKK